MEGYPTNDLPDLHRILRHRLRDRFRPRHLRHHQGTPHRPNLKCLRYPRSAGALLSARRCGGQVPLPQVWAGVGPYVRRPEDGLAERSVWWEIPDRLVPRHHHRVGGRLHCPLPHATSEKIHKLILPPRSGFGATEGPLAVNRVGPYVDGVHRVPLQVKNHAQILFDHHRVNRLFVQRGKAMDLVDSQGRSKGILPKDVPHLTDSLLLFCRQAVKLPPKGF